MIKHLFLDIDGILVGDQIKVNYPLPHPQVSKKLKEIMKKGIKITLCSTKAYFAIKPLIIDTKVNSYQITDGGGVILKDPNHLDELQISQINKTSALKLLNELEKNDLYIELFTTSQYYIKNEVNDITKRHTDVLGQPPIYTDNLSFILEHEDIIKIMLIARNKDEEQKIDEIGQSFNKTLSLSTGIHPIMHPYKIKWFSNFGITKENAIKQIITSEKLRPEECLAGGDSTQDWEFMKHSANVFTLENGTNEIKNLIYTSGKKGFIGDSVNNNGILDVFNFFNI